MIWSINSAIPLDTDVSDPKQRSVTVATAEYKDWKNEGTASNSFWMIYTSNPSLIATKYTLW